MSWWLSGSVLAAPPEVALVVVDLSAREEGYALELEGVLLEGEVLPVDVREAERVQVVDPDGGRHPLDVAAGEAWVVVGPHGEAWMARIGREVTADAVLVRGDDDAVRAVAAALGARVRAEEQAFRLEAPDLVYRLPWAEARGLDEVTWVAASAPPRPALDRSEAAGLAAVAAPAHAPPASTRVEPAPARVEPAVGRPEPSASVPPSGPTSGCPAYPVVTPSLAGSMVAVGRPDATGARCVAAVSGWRCGGLPVGLGASLTFQGDDYATARGDWWVSRGDERHLVARDATLPEANRALLRDGCPSCPAAEPPPVEAATCGVRFPERGAPDR